MISIDFQISLHKNLPSSAAVVVISSLLILSREVVVGRSLKYGRFANQSNQDCLKTYFDADEMAVDRRTSAGRKKTEVAVDDS